ncbi:hypothetical protein HanHA89_Chr03g0126501 [Helianthus annuus]|nr:hypothetical protein HanHA89_Chr03g0126501 [Helianthus annuus]
MVGHHVLVTISVFRPPPPPGSSPVAPTVSSQIRLQMNTLIQFRRIPRRLPFLPLLPVSIPANPPSESTLDACRLKLEI